MTPRQPVQQRGQRGSIIVLVLIFVVLLTFIVVAFLEEASARVKYYGLFHNRDDLRVDAYSALEIALAVINQYREVEGALWGPSQGWGNPLAETDFKPAHAQAVQISFEDESAKLPLQSMEYDDLLVLFDVLGFDLPEAEALADGLLDWTDEDDLRRLNGYDGDDYDDREPPYRPSNAPIVTWDEFRLIEPWAEHFWDENGIPNENWSRFRSAVSLYHTGPVNINQANETVLEVLSEKGLIDPRSLAYYKNGADGELGTEDDRLIREGQGSSNFILAQNNEISTSIELLRVTVVASRGEARFVVEALVTWAGANPGAGDAAATRPAEGETQENIDTEARTADDRRSRARGQTRTAPASVAKLGYPFRFVWIIENRKL